jgi:phosphatidylserine/phosphatidylglycerophosphate/cardiolipin synthase-like enzyme
MRSFCFKTLLISLLFFQLARADSPKIEVYFSPQGGCTAAIIDQISNAQKSIHVQAYSFTSRPIAKALIEANQRGVTVIAILDRSNSKAGYSEAPFLQGGHISVRLDRAHAIAHDKVMIIDDATVITGSFNFTTNAEYHNAENLLIIHDTAIAEKYEQNWQKHFSHSVQFFK